MHRLRRAFEARDFDAMADALAPDVVLHSPITGSVQFTGRAEVAELLRDVRQTFDELEYLHDFGDGETHALVFRARAGGRRVEGVDVLRLDSGGLVTEIRVFMRPLKGLASFTATFTPGLARRRGRLNAALVAAMVRPFALLARAGERPAARLTTGKRPKSR